MRPGAEPFRPRVVENNRTGGPEHGDERSFVEVVRFGPHEGGKDDQVAHVDHEHKAPDRDQRAQALGDQLLGLKEEAGHEQRAAQT